LIRIANEDGSNESRLLAITVLGGIGPPAKQAVPSLLQWASNTNADLRINALNSLRHIDPEAAAKAGTR
jgi:HEAT repeat protein